MKFSTILFVCLFAIACASAQRSTNKRNCTDAEISRAADNWNNKIRAELKLATLVYTGTFDAFEVESITRRLDAFTQIWMETHTSTCSQYLEESSIDTEAFDTKMACLRSALTVQTEAISAAASGKREVLDRLDTLDRAISRCLD